MTITDHRKAAAEFAATMYFALGTGNSARDLAVGLALPPTRIVHFPILTFRVRGSTSTLVASVRRSSTLSNKSEH